MNILIVALELAPYVQFSPAAASIGSLCKALRLQGHDLTIVAPRLPGYEEAGLMAARQLSPLSIEGAGEAIIFEVQLPSGSKLSLVEVESAPFDPLKEPHLQAKALGAFSSAVAALGKRQAEQGSPFEVVHAHDAGAGLVLLKLASFGAAGMGKVLTVHDADRSGVFSRAEGALLGISSERMSAQAFGSGDGICLLKGLVPEADAIVTPSDAYGRQLKATEKYGALSRAFQAVELMGVLEGVDHAIYNPSTDAALFSRYDAPAPQNKGRNKSALINELGLDLNMDRPLFFCEDAPDGDSALSKVFGALPALIRNDVTIVFSGSDELRAQYESLLDTFSENIHFLVEPSESQRRRMLAASDFYLSVQRRNPTGQRLLQAARYGAVPVAYRVDAVVDVVVDSDAELRTGTGLLFDSMTQRAIVGATARAKAAFGSPGWTTMLSRVMRQDLAWDRSARRHLQIYRQVAAAEAS